MISSPVFPALLAGLAAWGFTAAGAAFVFTPRACSRRTLDILLGFAAGVMLAASFWCLLTPALELAETSWGHLDFVPVAASLAVGALLLNMLDRVLPHACVHRHEPERNREHEEPVLPRNILLFFAVILHNIPEGLALGVAFGAALSSPEAGGLAGAVLLSCGICLHNLPVGMAVALPLLGDGCSRRKAFLIGQVPGLVEPVTTVLGAAVAAQVTSLLPYAMSFAAGAILYVVVSEVIPQAQGSGNGRAASAGLMAGFVLMMCLDHVFG